MMNLDQDKILSPINRKKALVFMAWKKLFKPIYKGKTKSFTGYQTIASFKAKGKETFIIDFQLIKGSCVLVLTQKNEYHILAETTTQVNRTVQLCNERARLRLIGKSCDVKYHIDRLFH